MKFCQGSRLLCDFAKIDNWSRACLPLQVWVDLLDVCLMCIDASFSWDLTECSSKAEHIAVNQSWSVKHDIWSAQNRFYFKHTIVLKCWKYPLRWITARLHMKLQHFIIGLIRSVSISQLHLRLERRRASTWSAAGAPLEAVLLLSQKRQWEGWNPSHQSLRGPRASPTKWG